MKGSLFESVQKMKADLGLLGFSFFTSDFHINPIPDVCIESKCDDYLIPFHTGCEQCNWQYPSKYVSGQFKISDAAVGEDEEQQDYYITSLLKAITLNICNRTINKC